MAMLQFPSITQCDLEGPGKHIFAIMTPALWNHIPPGDLHCSYLSEFPPIVKKPGILPGLGLEVVSHFGFGFCLPISYILL